MALLTYQNVIDQYQNLVRDPNGKFMPVENDKLLLSMNNLLKKLNREVEWGFSRSTQSVSTVAGTAAYTLDSGHQQIGGEFAVARTDDTTKQPLDSISEAEYRLLSRSITSQDEPQFFNIRQKESAAQRFEIVFLPTPNAVYVYGVSRKIEPTEVTESTGYASNFPLPPPHHMAVIHELAIETFAARRDWESVNYHQGFLTEAMRGMREFYRQPGMNPDFHEFIIQGRPSVSVGQGDVGRDSGDLLGYLHRKYGL